MRIAHVTTTFPPHYAGAGMVCYHNAVGAAERGHEVRVFTPAYPLENGYQDPPGVSVERLPAVFQIGNAAFMPRLFAMHDVDLIHLHWPFPFGSEAVWFSSRLRRIPYVITYHNDLIGRGLRRYLYAPYLALSTRPVFHGATKFITVSADHANACQHSAFFQQRGTDVVELPNGVDPEVFHPNLDGGAIRMRHGIGEDDTVLLFVGALDEAHHYRRVDILLQAFRELAHPGTYLLIVGGGNLLEHYRAVAEQLGVSTRVRFLGRMAHQDLPAIYNAADIVILPSQLQESFGMVLIEAMACGKPVIASNLPGVRTVVGDGADGLLVKPGDVADLVTKLRTLLGDPQRRREMGTRGRAKVESQYAWPRINDRLVQFYEEVVGGAVAANAGNRTR